MEKLNRDARRYLREIRRTLPCGRKEKNGIMEILEGTVDAFLFDNPHACRGDLEKRFGAPNQIASSYVFETEATALLGNLKGRKGFFKGILAVAVAVAVFWVGLVLCAYTDHKKDINGYAVVEVIEQQKTELD